MLEKLDLDLKPIEGGYRVATVGTHYVDVLIMLYSARVVETPIDCPVVYDRFWEYTDVMAALLAAYVWDGARDTEPADWARAWDGRRNGV